MAHKVTCGKNRQIGSWKQTTVSHLLSISTLLPHLLWCHFVVAQCCNGESLFVWGLPWVLSPSNREKNDTGRKAIHFLHSNKALYGITLHIVMWKFSLAKMNSETNGTKYEYCFVWWFYYICRQHRSIVTSLSFLCTHLSIDCGWFLLISDGSFPPVVNCWLLLWSGEFNFDKQLEKFYTVEVLSRKRC